MSRAASRLCCSFSSTSAPLLSVLGSFTEGHIDGEESRELSSRHIGSSQPALRFRLQIAMSEKDNSFCAWHSRSGPLRKRFNGDSSPGR
jgi:hypothetical protein